MTELRQQLQHSLGTAYTLERELGGGGMSRVFVARDESLGRQVVIKVLSPELAATLSAERFTREIRLAAALQEPHIVPVLAAGMTSEGLPFYTMPFVQGDTLRARMQAGPVPLDDAVRILRDIAQALAYAHERGIVHRDIKPENVLLSSGTAVVTDFGIAKAMSASSTEGPGNTLTSVGTSLGTPAYMAPEQAVGDRNTGPLADVYAWGVLAFELLAGVHPYAACTTPQAMVAAHISQPVPPLATTGIGANVPRALAALIMQCLSKEPAERPAAAATLVAELLRVPTSTDERAAEPPARRSRLPQVAVGVLVVAALLATGMWWTGRASERPAAPTGTTSLAVLPFADLSADQSSAYLGDGVAETLINALSKVSGLSVSARTSAFSFRGRENDLQAIGEQLGVTAVLTGSIQRAGDQLRITARAVRITNDSILWSQTFDRSANDIFAVQDEMARAVVSAMEGSLALSAPTREVGGTLNPDAYDAYLLGRYHWNLRTTGGMIQATAAFKKAIALDSGYALAWSGLADAYSLSVPSEYAVPGATDENMLPLAEAAARKAIALAPSLGEAHTSLGEAISQRGAYRESLAAHERGVALNPAYATGRQWYSYALMSSRRFDEAIREMEAAHRLDPLAHVITLSLAINYDGADRFAEASPLYAQGLAQSPQAWYGWKLRFAHDLALGQLDAAAEALEMTTRDPAMTKRAVLLQYAPLWRDPATREAATDSLIAHGPVFAAIPLARWLRNDSTLVAVFTRAAADPEQRDLNTAWAMYALLGPRLREDARLQPAFKQLGYPEMGRAR